MPHPDAEDADPVIGSYDIFITDADIRRFLLQYPDHGADELYNQDSGRKPLELRLKPKTGLVEVDIPIDTHLSYDQPKGFRYGNALQKSHVLQQGGTHGIAGGFNTGGGSGLSRANVAEDLAKQSQRYGGYEEDVDEYGLLEDDKRGGAILGHKTVGGRIQAPLDGDPIYMLGAFKDNQLHLAPLSALVQLRPQLHHLDAVDELALKNKALVKARREMDEEGGPAPEPEARAIDMKIKSTEVDNATVQSHNELLKKIQDEKWDKYEWVDENDGEAWEKYEEYMFNLTVEEPAHLRSAITADDYLEHMSAPRVDPVQVGRANAAAKLQAKAEAKAS